MSESDFDQKQDRFAKLPELAERLGIQPAKKRNVGWYMCTDDDVCYDVFELVNAALDRMDDIQEMIQMLKRTEKDTKEVGDEN